jgi:hypothetical protein
MTAASARADQISLAMPIVVLLRGFDVIAISSVYYSRDIGIKSLALFG